MQRRTVGRVVRTGAIGIAAALALTACSGGADSGSGSGDVDTTPVVIAGFGGGMEQAINEAYIADFTAETGIEVLHAPADAARFLAMSEAGASEWNTIDAVGTDAVTYIENDWILPLPEGVERSDLLSERFQDYAASGYLYTYVLVYRDGAFATDPTSFADFWDTSAFPGQRAIVGISEGFPEIALIADGVAPEDVYPLDLDRAFDKLDEIKPNLMITQGYAELRQAVETGQVDMAIMPSGVAANASIATGDLSLIWKDAPRYEAFFPISAYGPNQEGFAELVAYMQDPQRQATFASISKYGPAMSATADLLDEEVLPYVLTNPELYDQTFAADYDWYAEHNAEVIDRFSEWLAQ